MELKTFLIVFFLTGIILCLIFVFFRDNLKKLTVKFIQFANLYYFRFQLLSPVFSALAHIFTEGKWEKIRIIVEYYNKTEKFLISGKIIDVKKNKYDMPHFSSEIPENFISVDSSTPITEYLVTIEMNDGEIITVEFDIDKHEFKKMDLKIDGNIVDLPCYKYKNKNTNEFYFKNTN